MSSPAVQHVIEPPVIASPAAHYAHAVLVERATRWLHTSGVVPTAPDGSVPPEVSAQAEQVWRNIAAILAEAGMGPQNIVSVTTYLVVSAITPGLAQAMAARDAFLGAKRAASTLVTVPALARQEWLVEIAIVAAD
jgi:2-iminobutanoate/2-iminopropanoate deaminase